MKTKTIFTGLLLAGVIFTGCKKEEEEEVVSLKSQTQTTYAEIAYANYSDALSTAKELKTAIDAFVANPSESSQKAAKDSWLAAREPYGQTEAFRFSEGPIDDEDGPEGLMNAWPLDEGYIDYTSSETDSGIIANATVFPNLTATVLEAANEAGGDANVSIGYHAIEFLLWGQDLTEPSVEKAGQRSYMDYTTKSNASRRKEYLQVCSALLIENLQSLVDEWAPGKTTNFRATFLGWSEDEAMKTILTGLGMFSKGELAGERMFTAVKGQDQEDEHSCFSDNTHRDMILNAQSIRNILTGNYVRVDGSVVSGISLEDVIKEENATIAAELEALSASSVAQCNLIPVPFDLAISSETTTSGGPVMTSVATLQDQGDKIAEAAKVLGYTISIELPE
jgi:putative iron-regulated protein